MIQRRKAAANLLEVNNAIVFAAAARCPHANSPPVVALSLCRRPFDPNNPTRWRWELYHLLHADVTAVKMPDEVPRMPWVVQMGIPRVPARQGPFSWEVARFKLPRGA